eukprot:jgi/Psemu1/302108/fgenesh1_kg.58_\
MFHESTIVSETVEYKYRKNDRIDVKESIFLPPRIERLRLCESLTEQVELGDLFQNIVLVAVLSTIDAGTHFVEFALFDSSGRAVMSWAG